MTDAPNHKIKALELAIQHGGEKPADVVTRASAYHAFLAGTAAAPASKPATTGGAANSNKPADKGAATGGAATGANKASAATNKAADKGAATGANKAGAATNKAADKPAAGAANKPAAGASAAAVPNDTKAPNGKFNYGEMVAKLRDVQQSGPDNRAKAFEILAKHGGGAKGVREVKPANFDAVVAACDAFIKSFKAGAAETGGEAEDPLGDPPEQTAGGLAADDDPTAQPERDEMGLS